MKFNGHARNRTAAGLRHPAIVAEVRHDCNYATAAFGADHNTSVDALGNGFSHRFPLGRGFDYCYGFIAGETFQWEPAEHHANLTAPRGELQGLSLDRGHADRVARPYDSSLPPNTETTLRKAGPSKLRSDNRKHYMNTVQQSVQRNPCSGSVLALSAMLAFGVSTAASADEADAKNLIKAMSDYLGAQTALSFEYDATLEVITQDMQRLALASSGTVTLSRPNEIIATRSSGFADVEMSFDGTTLILLGKKLNLYTQKEVPGTVEHLVDELREKYNRPLPAADLLLPNAYDVLMRDVVDVKDLGSGVIGGVECDYIAVRAKEVDWQIWIAQGERPYPCRYSITTTVIDGSPQYTIDVRNWKTGDEVAAADFSFKNSTNASQVELEDLKGTDALPAHFVIGEAK